MQVQAQPGQTVSFVYNGGSNPGSKRLVLVEKNDDGHINGRDLASQDYRSYRVDRIQGAVDLVARENEEVVPLTDFLSPALVSKLNLNDPITLARVKQTFDTFNSPERSSGWRHGHFVARRTDLPRVEILIDNNGTAIDFVNTDGKRLGLFFKMDVPIGLNPLPFRLHCPIDLLSLGGFTAQLDAHVNLGDGEPSTTAPGWDDHVVEQAKKGNGIYAELAY